MVVIGPVVFCYVHLVFFWAHSVDFVHCVVLFGTVMSVVFITLSVVFVVFTF